MKRVGRDGFEQHQKADPAIDQFQRSLLDPASRQNPVNDPTQRRLGQSLSGSGVFRRRHVERPMFPVAGIHRHLGRLQSQASFHNEGSAL